MFDSVLVFLIFLSSINAHSCIDDEFLQKLIVTYVTVNETGIWIQDCCGIGGDILNREITFTVFSENRCNGSRAYTQKQCHCCTTLGNNCGFVGYYENAFSFQSAQANVSAGVDTYSYREGRKTKYCDGILYVDSTAAIYTGFNLPKHLGDSLKLSAVTESSYNLTMSDLRCAEGQTAKFQIAAIDGVSSSTEGTAISLTCCASPVISQLSLRVDGLKSETAYTLTITAQAVVDNNVLHTDSASIIDIPPTLAMVPSITAKLSNVSSSFFSITWDFSSQDCVSSVVIFLLSYETEEQLSSNMSTMINNTSCSVKQSVSLTVPLLPYRTFNGSAVTCNHQGRCGKEISFTGITQTAEPTPINGSLLVVTITGRHSAVSYTYEKRDCTGPTTFTGLAFCKRPNCQFDSNTLSFSKCPTDAVPVDLLFDKLYYDTDYTVQLVASVRNVDQNTTIANLSFKTEIVDPTLPSQLSTHWQDRYLQLIIDFKIWTDCVSNTLRYRIELENSHNISTYSNFTVVDCITYPYDTVMFNFSNLHPYRNYTFVSLTNCNSNNTCKTTKSFDYMTFEIPVGEPKQLASESIWLEFDAKTSRIHAYANYTYDDCMGPTNFYFTLKLLIGSELDLSFEPIIIPRWHPNCPITVDKVNATMRVWHPYRSYQHSVTLSTGVGSAQTTTNVFSTNSTEAQTLTSNATIKSISSSQIEISLLFNNDDCYGPTSFKIDYVSSNGVSGSTTVQSSNYPYCPRFLIPSVETFLIQNVQQESYRFYITPYTDKGTSAKPLLVEYKVPIETSGTSWYVIAVPIIVAVVIVAIVIFGVIKYRRSNKLQDIPVPNTVDSNFYRRPIKVSEYAVFYKRLTKTWQLRLKLEYQRLALISPKLSDSRKTPVAMLAHNKMKNRFPDVLPFDYNRVRLGHEYINFRQTRVQSSSNTFTTDDYINASFIEVGYIAAMGPISVEESALNDKVETVADFLQMILEQNVKVVVMLTMPEEQNQNTTKIKSAKYWPSNVGQSVRFADYTVELVTEEFPTSDYDIRTLKVSKNDASVLLHHFLYKDMLDYGITRADKMLNFVRKVQSVSVENPSNPIAIHCSAGAGRTGTFIAIDQLLQQLNANVEILDVFNTVYNLRKQRVKMVQTQAQYRLVYDTVALAIQQSVEGSDHTYENVPETDAYENA